jgi:serine/threonine protein kinase
VAELAPGGDFAGYRIERVVGRGGMGIVYLARQSRPDRRVALKVVAPHLAEDPEFRRRFEREATSVAQIEHPNVIPIYEVGEEDGVVFISMRFVDGVDLDAQLRTTGGLAARRAASIVAQVGAALDAAHASGLVHRDVKPANILIGGTLKAPQVYLTDFGLTRAVAASAAMTASGMVVGTFDYMAPEQARGDPVDARTDVYALGCVLFQSLTGSVPYTRATDAAKLYAHVNEPPPRLGPEFSTELQGVITRALAKDPSDRFASAGALGDAALEATTAERGAPPAPATELKETLAVDDSGPPVVDDRRPPSPPVPQARPRTKVVLAGLLLLALLGGGAAAVVAGQGSRPAPPLSVTETVTTETFTSETVTTEEPAKPPPGTTGCGGGLSVGPNTSCPFAREVRSAYLASGGRSRVRAYSPTTGQSYRMSCTSGSPHLCTGGNDAAVYFP